MTEKFRCAIEDANRHGSKRCQVQCQSCKQQFLTGDEGRVLTDCETNSGLFFDFADPRPEQITLNDVATHLSRVVRFAGAVPFSVGQHAINARNYVVDAGHHELALAALHHDDHEYMLGDWPTPLKRLLRESGVTLLDDIRAKADIVIAEKFGIDVELFDHPLVREADMDCLYREASTFLPSRGVGPRWGREVPSKPVEYIRNQPPKTIAEQFKRYHYADGGRHDA